MQIPTLILTCKIKAEVVFLINGTWLGSGDNNKVSLPVAPNLTYYITVLPLSQAYSSITRKIEIENGLIKNDLQSDVTALIWREGIIELEFLPQEYIAKPKLIQNAEQLAEQVENISSKTLKNLAVANLTRQSNLYNLSIYTKNSLIFNKNFDFSGEAVLEIFDNIVFVRISNNIISFCVIIKINNNNIATQIFSGIGDKIIRDGKNIIITSKLETSSNYQKQDKININTGKIINSEIGFFGEEKNIIESEQGAIIALMEAIKFGVHDDINALLGGELEGLNLETLREFFGKFSTVKIAPSQVQERIVIGLFENAQVSQARLFGFECEQENQIALDQQTYKVLNAYEI